MTGIARSEHAHVQNSTPEVDADASPLIDAGKDKTISLVDVRPAALKDLQDISRPRSGSGSGATAHTTLRRSSIPSSPTTPGRAERPTTASLEKSGEQLDQDIAADLAEGLSVSAIYQKHGLSRSNEVDGNRVTTAVLNHRGPGSFHQAVVDRSFQQNIENTAQAFGISLSGDVRKRAMELRMDRKPLNPKWGTEPLSERYPRSDPNNYVKQGEEWVYDPASAQVDRGRDVKDVLAEFDVGSEGGYSDQVRSLDYAAAGKLKERAVIRLVSEDVNNGLGAKTIAKKHKFEPYSFDTRDKIEIVEKAMCERRGPGTVHQAILDRASIDQVLQQFELSGAKAVPMLEAFKLERQPRDTRWGTEPLAVRYPKSDVAKTFVFSGRSSSYDPAGAAVKKGRPLADVIDEFELDPNDPRDAQKIKDLEELSKEKGPNAWWS